MKSNLNVHQELIEFCLKEYGDDSDEFEGKIIEMIVLFVGTHENLYSIEIIE